MKADIEAVKADCIIDENGCWVWTRSSRNGYAQIYMSSLAKTTKGHRLTYMLVKGDIPEGKVLDHLCRNKICVNPEHLEPVTTRENILRGEGKTAIRARQTHCIHGHPLSGYNLYITSRGYRLCMSCQIERNKKANVVKKRKRHERAEQRKALQRIKGELGEGA